MNNQVVQVDTVLLKVASRCNINCNYCYVYNMGDEGWRDMPALVSEETIDATCRALGDLREEQEKPFAIVLHGGEPLMLGARRLNALLKELRRVIPAAVGYQLSVQTNGLLITSEILDICDQHDTSLSVSLDGPKPVNDRFRIGKKGEGTHDAVVRGIRLLRGHPASKKLFSGVLAVIDPFSNPVEVYHYLKGLGAPSIDFLYRDGNHTVLPFGKSSVESTEYADWMIAVLNTYLADSSPPRIRILDDLIKLSLGGRGIKEGSGQEAYGIAIIDTDGSINKNDTLKSTFNGADRFSTRWSVHTHRLTQVFASEDFRKYFNLQRPTSTKCSSCPELGICGGGMPLHRWRADTGFDNPSVYCADQQLLIAEIRQHLRRAGLPT